MAALEVTHNLIAFTMSFDMKYSPFPRFEGGSDETQLKLLISGSGAGLRQNYSCTFI
jgi:hypothetical protein